MQQVDSNINQFNKLVQIICQNNNPKFVDNQDIEFESSIQNEVHSMLQDIDIESEMINPNFIRININQFNFNCFSSLDSFLNHVKLEHFSKDIAILDFKCNEYTYFNITSKNIFINGEIKENFLLFDNTKSYLEFLNFIKKQEDTGFIDYFNSLKREIIITSPSKEGKLIIGYTSSVPKFDTSFNIGKKINKFYETFNTKELPKFIKNEIFPFLITENPENRLEVLINKLDIIIDSAERNFDLYLTGFSFDDLKNGYFSKRENFLEQIRNVLNKVSVQVIALPLSISAVVFASYSVNNSIFTLLLILSSFSVFTFYFFYLLNFYSQDLSDLKNIVNAEFKNIKDSEFFKKHPDDLNRIDNDKIMIDKKIKRLKNSISFLFFLVVSFNLLFCLHITTQIFISIYIKILIVFLYLMISIIIFFVVGKNG